VGVVFPEWISAGIFLVFIPLGIIGLWKILTFQEYYEVNKELLSGLTNQMDTPTEIIKNANEKVNLYGCYDYQ
jgi:hypothetical protein